MALTTRKIQALAPKDKRYVVTDGAGLNLRVHPSGVKSWVLRVSQTGRVVDVTLGRWPDLSLKQARQLARKKKQEFGLEPPRGYTLLDVQRALNGRKSKFVFLGQKGNHIHQQHLTKWLHSQSELCGRLVAHGLRSLARSWLADQGVQYEVAEACLAHAVGSRVSRAYQRSDFLDVRRPVMEAWCSHILTCAEMARISIENSDAARDGAE